MAHTITDETDVREYQTVREYLQQHTTFFGLIKWYKLVWRDTVGEEIYVHVKNLPPYIMVNTTKYWPAPKEIQ